MELAVGFACHEHACEESPTLRSSGLSGASPQTATLILCMREDMVALKVSNQR